MKLGNIGAIALDELDRARGVVDARWKDDRVEHCEPLDAIAHALVSIAASLYRLQAVPARLPFDPLDTVDPPESETEHYWSDRAERQL